MTLVVGLFFADARDELVEGVGGVEGEEPFAPEEDFVLDESLLGGGELVVEVLEDARGFFVELFVD